MMVPRHLKEYFPHAKLVGVDLMQMEAMEALFAKDHDRILFRRADQHEPEQVRAAGMCRRVFEIFARIFAASSPSRKFCEHF